HGILPVLRRVCGLLEQIVERLLGARRARRRRGRLGLALDRRARLEEGAGIARILGGDARGDRLVALYRRAGVEVGALRARVQIPLAARALPFRAPGDRHRQLVAAAGTLHYFTEAVRAQVLGRDRRLAARRVFLLLFRLALAARFARLVLVASLAILPLRHVG